MLEKIGLPPKPFLKENEWVVDASHCQSCASAFSLFNFKHHCRRCGGLFCGNCTQQRMYLRGQGNGTVRICRACKDIEHATRFQPRTAPKNKAKGSLKLISSPDTDIMLKQILGSEADSFNLGSGDLVEDENGGSPSILISSQGVSSRPAMAFADEKEKESSITPQSLREAAQEEKKNWLALKKQGKAKEATKAFKRGKELEREAEALELSLRNQKKGLMESTSQHVVLQDDVDVGRAKKSQSLPLVKREKGTKKSLAMGEKDDLMGALRELGWSDAEIHAEDKKQGKSVESELEVLAMSTRSESHSEIAPSQVAGVPLSNEVLAHKRKALALKREGKMAEAKEELKKAKILEKQIEEQEIFGGGDEDSDDEFAALVRSMEKEGKAGKKGPSVFNDIPVDFDMGNLLSIGEEEVDISDTDMGDPEMIAALRSMGWEEEVNALGEGGEHLGRGGEANLKRRNKPTKNGTIGMEGIPFSLNDDGEEHVEVTAQDMNDPDLLLALKAIGFAEEEPSVTLQPVVDMAKPSRREKANLQQQILAIKREALTLKRAGKLEEAREKLCKAKKMEAESQSEPISEELFVSTSSKTSNKTIIQHRAKSERAKSFRLGIIEDDLNDVENTLVSEEDMMDPELLKALESVGWQKDDGIAESKKATDTKRYSEAQIVKRKKEVQKELLSLKRAALKLRREGKKEEAEEELRKASELESVMGELESAESELKGEMERGGKNESQEGLSKAKRMEAEFQIKPISEEPFVSTLNKTSNKTITQQIAKNGKANSFHLGIIEDDSNNVQNTLVSEEDMMDPELLKALESVGWQEDDRIAESKKVTDTKRYSEAQIVKRKKEVQKELLSLKRAALKLRREGKKEEAEEELRKASELELVMQELESAELELKTEMEKVGKDEASRLPSDASLIEMDSVVETFDLKLLGTPNDLGLVGESESESNRRNNSLLKSASAQKPAHSIDVEEPLQAKKHYSEAQVAKKKREVQKELLGVKRLALKLRREGHFEEAEEELKKSSELELLMKELELAELEFKRETVKNEASQVATNVSLMDLDSMVGTLDSDVLSTLKDMGAVVGLEDESNHVRNPSVTTSTTTRKPSLEDSRSRVVEPSGPVYNSNRREGGLVPLEPLVDVHQNISGGLDLLSGDDWRPEESQKSKGEIEKMGSGNASRKLDGNLDGNFDGVPKKGNASRKFDGNSDGKLDKKSDGKLDGVPKKGNVSQKFDGMSDGKLDEKMDAKFDGVPKKGSLATESSAVGAEAVPPRVVASADRSPVHQEVLEHKRKALMLKREGRIAEAKEELRLAKALEREMELASTMETPPTTATTVPPMEDRKVKAKEEPASLVMKIERQSPPLKDVNIHPTTPPVSQKQGRPGKDRFKLQQESLAHKRKALALRREGKAEEAEAEFEIAKSIEMQMEEMDGGGVGGGLHEAESSAQDELLDPQLLAALKGLGFNPADIIGSNTAKTIPSSSSSSSSSSSKLPDTRERKPDNANVVRKPPPEASASSQRDEKSKLMENIKAMKLHALQLKKAGKQSEALEALRSAKQLQNKLESMNS